MRQKQYKKETFKKWLIPRVVGASVILVIVLLVVVLTTLNQSEQLYYEGISKSMPLLSNDKMKMLGDLYIKLNRNFEKEIKDMELNYANRYNKRGDKIHYGVNGKENVVELYNEDYVNGINITYVKGKANRTDGDSNFNDMISFLTTALYSNMDEYSDEDLKDVFEKLFNLTHTFSGTSTELYPCEHGCAWCKYYCGDSRCQGALNGNTVGFYKSDMYMGKEGQYGLMYDPFVIDKKSNYTELQDLAGDEIENKTTYQYKVLKSRVVGSEENERTEYYIGNAGDTVVAEDDEIYDLMEPEGYCPVCSGGRQTFTSTTKKIGGCITHVECHHGEIKHISGEGSDDPGYDIFWYMGRDRKNCDNATAVFACTHEHSESCEWSDSELEEAEANGINVVGCKHQTLDCKPADIGCSGYYVCETGHEHYACPGHIIVCCFGHTNLNLEIKIMYYEEMIEELKTIIS